jgi:hypothetical protein
MLSSERELPVSRSVLPFIEAGSRLSGWLSLH